MEIIDKQFLETPWCGSRQMARFVQRNNHKCGRHRVRRLMRKMRLVPIYQTPNTSKKHPQHKLWPYLLKGLMIDRPNQVWCADITYIPMRPHAPPCAPMRPHAPRLSLPRHDHGLAQPKGSEPAAVK